MCAASMLHSPSPTKPAIRGSGPLLLRKNEHANAKHAQGAQAGRHELMMNEWAILIESKFT
jgi:hypothetical protein